MKPLEHTPDTAPTTHIDTGPTLPAWTLHAALAVAILGAVCAAAAATPLDTSSLVLLLAGLLVAVVHAAWRPSLVPAVAALAVTGLACLVLTPTEDGWRVPVIVVCVHALVRLSWFTSSSRPGGRIEVAVLRHEGRSFLALDLAGQAVGVLAVVLTGMAEGEGSGGSAVLGVAGAVGLLGLAAVLVAPRSRTA